MTETDSHETEGNQTPQRKGGKRAFAFGAVAAMVVCALLALLLLRGCMAGDGGATLGTYDGKTQEEIQAELDRKAKESMMTVSLDVTPELDRAGKRLEVRVQNVEKNHFNQLIEVIQDDEVIGSFKGLKPGEKINAVDVEGCEGGDAVIKVTPLDMETNAVKGNSSAFEVTIHRAGK